MASMLNAGRRMLWALCQFGSVVSDVNRPRPSGPAPRARSPGPSILSKRDSSHSSSTSANPDTTTREYGPIFRIDMPGEGHQAFEGVVGIQIEQVADEQVAWGMRDRLQGGRGGHSRALL